MNIHNCHSPILAGHMDMSPESDIHETVLHAAVKTKNFDNVSKAMVTGGDIFINNLDAKDRSPIHIAIEEHLESIVLLFLSTVKEKINDSQYLLQYAIEKGNIDIVKLLAQHYSIEARDKQNVTAFCAAVRERKFEVLDHLLNLRNTVDTRSTNYNDRAVFYLAVIAGNTELVEKFLESDFPINSCLTANANGWCSLNDHSGFSPLHLAVKYLRLNLVELLLSQGADVTIKNEAKSTALHLAFEAKVRGIWKTWEDFETNDKIIDALIDAQQRDSIKQTNGNEISHLHIACSRDSPEIIESFLQDKSISAPDFAIEDNQGFTCLHYAAKYRCHKIARVLLQYNMNVNQRDDELRTPLHIASRETSLEIIQLLIQHGADLTLKDCRENTPVHLAFNDRNYEVLDLLLTNRTIANSNPTNFLGVSHFHIACTRNDINLVRSFIDAGVSVDLQVSTCDFKISSRYNKHLDWRGCVPLHFAAAFNRAKVVELLLTHGADVHSKDTKGFSSIHMACQQTYDRFGEFISKTVRSWLNDYNFQVLYRMSVLIQNRPYSDVTSVDEETRVTTYFYPRRFPNISSQNDLSNIKEMFLIGWELHKQEQVEIIKMLFEHGADLNVLDSFGNSPLFYIYDFNIHKLLDVLHEKVHLDKNLGTLIVKHLLVEMYARRSCLLTVIFNFGIFVNIDKSYNNGSILHYVCQKNEFYDTEKVKILRYFLKKNADPDAINDLNETPLHTATKNSHECVLFQFDTGPRDFLPHRSRESVDMEEMVITLLKNGARVNFRNNEGRTPLFSACLSKKFLTYILLHHGADVNIKDRHGKPVVYYFFRDHMKLSVGNTVEMGIVTMAEILVQHVQALQELGLRVSENVEEPISQMIRLLKSRRNKPYDDVNFRAKLGKQVEQLKNTKINSQVSLYDVLFMDEYNVSRDVIIEQLEKMLHPSKSYYDIIPCYFHFVYHKYRIAVERKRLLSEAKRTLNRLLQTNFPEVCSDFIFIWLKNIEIAYFVKAFAVLHYNFL